MHYHRHIDAAHAISVHPITIRRWIQHGWIYWPKGQRHLVQHEHLTALRDYIAATRYDVIVEKVKARRKYRTQDERDTANYQAVKRFRHRNPMKVRILDTQSRNLKRHPLFHEMRSELLAFYGTTCLKCRRRKATCLDHVIPLSLHGSNHPHNLQPLCRPCNTSKRNHSTDYRHDYGRWIAIRWGGWVVNGRLSTINPDTGRGRMATVDSYLYGSVHFQQVHQVPATTEHHAACDDDQLTNGQQVSNRREMREEPGSSAFTARHRASVHQWRLDRIPHGALLTPEAYKLRNPSVQAPQ